jgi:nucleotide-binding universal stress UspA family protein
MNNPSTSTARSVRSIFAAALLATTGLATMGPAFAADDLIVILPEGASKPARLSADVARWRAELGSADLVFVDSVKRDKPSGFASMAVLDFTSASQMKAWQEANAASLGSPLRAVPVDVLTRGGAAPQAGAKPVYKISYYTLTSPRETFQTWVDGYLTPYLDMQLESGILTRYAMYLEDVPSGRALLVLEYTDAKTEAGAEPIKARQHEEYARKNAGYAQLAKLKESLRTTESWTVAVPAN